MFDNLFWIFVRLKEKIFRTRVEKISSRKFLPRVANKSSNEWQVLCRESERFCQINEGFSSFRRIPRQIAVLPCYNFDNATYRSSSKLAKSSGTKKCKMTVGHRRERDANGTVLPLFSLSLTLSVCLSLVINISVDYTQRPIVSRGILPLSLVRAASYTPIQTQNSRKVVDRAAISGRGRWRYEREAKNTHGQRMEKLEKRTYVHEGVWRI